MKNSLNKKEAFFKKLIELERKGRDMELQKLINDNLKHFTPLEVSELLEFSKENRGATTVSQKDLENFKKEKRQALAREYFIDPSQKSDPKTIEEAIDSSSREEVELDAIETIVLKM